MCFHLYVDAHDTYLDPGRYSALGALALLDLPPIVGQKVELRLTATPLLWCQSQARVRELLGSLSLQARFSDRSLVVKVDHPPFKDVLKLLGLACFALDPFTRFHVQPEVIEDLRRKALGLTEEDWLIDLLSPDARLGAIRNALQLEREPLRRQPRTETPLHIDTPGSLTTLAGKTILIDEASWNVAGEVLSLWTVDPRWLVYLPPDLCTLQRDPLSGILEHPSDAFSYYKEQGIGRVIAQASSSGSRAVLVVCRDRQAAKRRFGIADLGAIYTRTGRPFFEDSEFLKAIHSALSHANFWEMFSTDWVCLDGDIVPWTTKGTRSLADRYELLHCGLALHKAREESRSTLTAEEIDALPLSRAAFKKYETILSSHARSGPPRFIPFQLVATEGRSHLNQNQNWQLRTLSKICQDSGTPFVAPNYRSIDLGKEQEVRDFEQWWKDLSATGQRGVIVRAVYGIPRGKRGQAQPAIQCRTHEYLRLVYGPDYDLREQQWRLASREGLSHRRERSRRILKQFNLAVDAVQRFVSG